MEEQIPDLNLFMMCKEPNRAAFSVLPPPFYFDLCRPEELDIWMAFPFDEAETAKKKKNYMEDYFENVYASQKEAFFSRCLFVRSPSGEPVGTCFLWKAYGKWNTLHWFKVKKEYEGRGIGRGVLTKLLSEPGELPVFLHTQPGSYRAVKLYSDFGFELLTDRMVGRRENHLREFLPILQKYMPPSDYQALRFAKAPLEFLQTVSSSDISEF